MRQNTTANRFKSKVAVAQGDDEQGSVESLANLSPKTIWQSVRREHLAFWAICGWLFFEYVKPQAIYGWLDFMPWSMTCILAAFVLSFAKGDKAPNYNGLTAIHAGLVAFFLVVLLSSIFAYNSAYSFSKATVMGQWFIVYYLVLKIVNTERRFFIFFLLYLLCNFKMSQHGFVSWVSRGFSFADFGVSGSPGWFMNSGEFAMQMCVFLPLSIAFIQAFKNRWSKLLYYFMLLFPISAFSSILASSSRGAILGLIAIGLSILFQRKKIFKRLAVVVVAFGIAFAFTPPEFKERFTTAGEDDTSTLRLHYWGIATDIGNSNPVLGIGYYNWIPYFKAYHFDPSIKYKPEEVHSTYFQALAELGYSGLLLLFLFAFFTWRINRYSVKLTAPFIDDEVINFYNLTAKALNYGLLSLMVTSTFISALYYPFFWIQALLSALVCIFATVRSRQLSSSGTIAAPSKFLTAGSPLPVKSLTSRHVPSRR
ncbi:O-antigen ligase family protein [Allohahella sp. A8]|uniref:O-antigen ligase family protein n=1 Tax=Allohahella sp. A8 TaxID=3141461 RepID=UPI003A7F8C9D